MYMYDDRQFPFPFFPNVPSQGQGNQMGPGGQAGAPTSPPPSFTPQQSSAQVFAVDPGSIRGCLFRIADGNPLPL
ncbi:hypothetical protein J2S13_000364 [Oikeobacillus pervagus]|uniref:Uncharacterized protein n=1 Tax=Oikeobacillus pervagus TaxID=1325931 RepID=A0AAJ1T0Z6_9BACI|nr:hypothetical protein [Oikeobacillus pervagus]